jgi:hypothetical protein
MCADDLGRAVGARVQGDEEADVAPARRAVGVQRAVDPLLLVVGGHDDVQAH